MDSDESGVDTQFTPGRVTNKKFPDILVGNKKGLFLFHHHLKQVDKTEWKPPQPKPISPHNPTTAS